MTLRDNQLSAHKVPRVRACAMSHASRFPDDGDLCIVNSQDGIWPVQARLTHRPVRPLLPATVLKKNIVFAPSRARAISPAADISARSNDIPGVHALHAFA